ncbi:MAG: DUF2304 domain-containing protein [Lapillicoccus sp.]
MIAATPVPISLRDVSGYPFALVVCIVLLAALGWLLRSQRLREKYAIIWFGVVGGLVVLGFVPVITTWLTRVTGVTTPINLVFILAFLVLLVVSIQLSLAISRLEENTRTIAEEVALVRLELEQHLAGGCVPPSEAEADGGAQARDGHAGGGQAGDGEAGGGNAQGAGAADA